MDTSLTYCWGPGTTQKGTTNRNLQGLKFGPSRDYDRIPRNELHNYLFPKRNYVIKYESPNRNFGGKSIRQPRFDGILGLGWDAISVGRVPTPMKASKVLELCLDPKSTCFEIGISKNYGFSVAKVCKIIAFVGCL